MEILPQFTQSIIFTGSKKRSRSPYDLEGHCTKKRWIEPSNPIDHYGKTNIPGQATSVSVMPEMGPNESKGVTPPPKHHVEIDDVTDDMMMFNPCPSFVDSEHEIIVPMNINGSFLPMEKRPGENKYRIPSFVLSHPPQKEISPCSGQLVLYQKPLVPLSDDTETDDEDDQDTMGLDPMDID